MSIVWNIAEGAGDDATADQARCYRMARRSSTECAAISDIMETPGDVDTKSAEQLRDLLQQVAAMLTAMVKRRDAHQAQGTPLAG